MHSHHHRTRVGLGFGLPRVGPVHGRFPVQVPGFTNRPEQTGHHTGRHRAGHLVGDLLLRSPLALAAGPTRTPTGCSASTSRRGPTCPATTPTTSTSSPPSSIPDPE